MHTLILMNLMMMATVNAAPDTAERVELSNEERARLVALLVDAAHDDGHDVRWVGIHAAEALSVLGRPELVVDTFRRRVNSTLPGYRVCVWRVLARAEADDDARRQYVERIRRVLLDPEAPDRVHAMEALAKLNAPIGDADERRIVREAAESKIETGSPFALWRLAQTNDRDRAIGRLTLLSKADDKVTRLRALYVLARLRPLPLATQQALVDALAAEPAESVFRPALVCAVGGAEVARLARTDVSAGARYAAAMQLGEEGCDEVRQVLWPLVDDADADVRVAAAFAILRLTETRPRP